MTKKILLFLILLSSLPLAHLQAQTYYHTDENGIRWRYTISGGNATITGATKTNGTAVTGALNIPDKVGTTPEYDVTAIGNNAFSGNSLITSLRIPEDVTIIGNSAFQNCTGLTGLLKLPKVTTIGSYAFYRCSFTGSLELPEVTTIGTYAFYGGQSFNGSLKLPKVTTIGEQAFYGCKNFTGSLELPKATSIGARSFYACTGFNGTLKLPEITTIEQYVFQDCTGFTSLEIPKVITIGERAFDSCTGLAGTLELPKTLTSIGRQAFQNCRTLASITFENGTNLANTTGELVFRFCFHLQYIDMTGVTFPSTFTTVSRNNTFWGGIPPFTMVYLPNNPNLVTASGQENFVIGNTCDRFVVYDRYSNYKSYGMGCDYSILYNFKATTAEYRNSSITSFTCKTRCLPYKATLPTGMRAYKLVAKTRGGKAFRFVSIGDGNGTVQLEANTPYLIRIINGYSFTNNNWASSSVQVPVTPATMEIALPDGQTFFGGTTTNIDNATAASNNYYNLYNDTWYPIKTSDTRGYVHSFRAYIRTTGGTPAKGFAMVIDDEENATTDIDNAAELTEDELKSGKHTFYTLDGRRAGTNYDTLKSGEMYVVKGQKFYKF